MGGSDTEYRKSFFLNPIFVKLRRLDGRFWIILVAIRNCILSLDPHIDTSIAL